MTNADQPIIDAHVHLDSATDETLAADRQAYREVMEEAGIMAAMVMGKSTYHIDFYSEHERLLELCQHDDDLFAIINFDVPTADDRCLAKVEEWLTSGAAHAAKIYPGYDPFYPHRDERSLALCALLEQIDKPLIVHTGDPVTPQGRLRYARPIHLDELAVRFPKLRIVMAHLGNPFFDEAQAVLYKNAHVVADGSGLFMSRGEEFVADAYIEELIRRLRGLMAYVDADDSIMFGGDFSYTNAAHHVSFWELVCAKLEFTDEERHRLFYENARRLFQLPLPEVS